MRIGIVGAGAVGSLLGGSLVVAGHDVTLVDRRAARTTAAAAGHTAPGGLDLVAPDGSRRHLAVARVAGVPDLPADLDVVVLAVKQFDLPDAVDALSALPGVAVVTVQNGVGAEDAVAARRPHAPLIAASLTAATELGPVPEVRWLRRGGIGLAGVRGDTGPLVAGLAAAFGSAGLPAVVFADATAMKWSKLVANLVANATSALLDMDPARIYGDPLLFPVERRQLLEAATVMTALGARPVELPGAHVIMLLRGIRLPEVLARPLLARAIGGARGGKSPSLRLHLRGGATGPTEVRWLNGAVAATGARLGVPTPVNAMLATLVEEAGADHGRADWWAGRPDRLRAAVDALESPRPRR